MSTGHDDHHHHDHDHDHLHPYDPEHHHPHRADQDDSMTYYRRGRARYRPDEADRAGEHA